MPAREVEGDCKRAADLERAAHGQVANAPWLCMKTVISGSHAMNKHATHKSVLPGSFFRRKRLLKQLRHSHGNSTESHRNKTMQIPSWAEARICTRKIAQTKKSLSDFIREAFHQYIW
ncbi:hypothetical protein EZI45_08495 [Delftia tsuruhatensis]|uniref:hypothetical protein n=1 Tax=Delftia tsuruhatensis TaxID=180282 RepID=UPI0010EEA56C|nr:hypothetical protein [Delftia tsuruhatensis]TDF30688.1 hypothetical protein EZI45_08495 [Delftia tsuruhatensis]